MFKLVVFLTIISAFHFICSTVIQEDQQQTGQGRKTIVRAVAIISRHSDRYPYAPDDSNRTLDALLGDLTESGRQRMRQLGREIRIRYADLLQESDDAAAIRALSSPVQGSIDSVTSLLTGLSPDSMINVTVDEMLSAFGNKCPAFWSMIDRISNSESSIEFNEKLGSFFDPGNSYSTNQTVAEQLLRLKELCDRKLMLGTGRAVPDNKSLSLAQECIRILCLLTSSKQAQEIMTIPLIFNVQQTFGKIASGTNTTDRFVIVGTHDTMIDMLLHSLKSFNRNTVPAYASSVIIELRESVEPSGHFYNKFFFWNGEHQLPGSDLTPTGCFGRTLCPSVPPSVTGLPPPKKPDNEAKCASSNDWPEDNRRLEACFA